MYLLIKGTWNKAELLDGGKDHYYDYCLKINTIIFELKRIQQQKVNDQLKKWKKIKIEGNCKQKAMKICEEENWL